MHLSNLFSVVKRSFLFLFLLLLVSLPFFAKPLQIFAQTQPNPYVMPVTNADVPQNLHTLTQTVTLEVLSSAVCLLGGYDPLSQNHQCLGYDTNTHRIGYVQSDGGLLGASGKLVSMVIMPPPVHTSDYVHYLAGNFGLTRPIYAQSRQQQTINQAGTGFAGITPLLPIWTVFRNIVYVFFVILFVLVGFAVMLRYKIDPRTVMTIENQLPKLIVGLLLVTFSFAIAGIAIDIMWVVTFLVINVLTNIHSGATTGVAQNVVTGSLFQNPLGFFNVVGGSTGGFLGTAFGAGGSIKDLIQGMFTSYGSDKLGLIPPSQDCGAWWNWACYAGNSVTSAVGAIVAWIVGILGTLVVLIALIIAMFKLWFSLLLAYGYILIDILIGPFMILAGMFPGSKIDVTAWLRDLFANLVSFPVAIAMFLIANLLMNSMVPTQQLSPDGGTHSLFVPPLIGNPNGIADPNNPGNPLGWLIALAIILMTPEVVNMMKDLFKAPQLKYTQAAGQAIAGAAGLTINTGKNIGKTIVSSKEYIAGPGGFRARGWGGAVLGSLLGR